MSGRVFSVILLPTSECNVACDYCFEHKEPHRLSLALLPLLTRRLLDHLENEGIAECEIYWQGGEAMLMGPEWFSNAGAVMDNAARERGRKFIHYLQTNPHRLLTRLEQCDPPDVQWLDRDLDGLSQRASQVIQGWP